MSDMSESLFDECRNVIVMERVEHPAAVTKPGDETEMAQHAQMIGDRVLLHAHLSGQFPDWTGGMEKTIQDLYTYGRGQRLHDLGYGKSLLLRDQFACIPWSHTANGTGNHVTSLVADFPHLNTSRGHDILSS